MDNSRPLLIVTGPTATGKTSLALQLAKKFNGQLISCDSRQVYKYMDIVTGKDIPTGFTFRRVGSNTYPNLGYYHDDQTIIWGYDLVQPNEDFSVKHYLEFAYPVINNCHISDSLPILVGGTGMYIKSLLNPPETISIPVNIKLRAQLKSISTSELFNMLVKIDNSKSKTMTISDRTNPRRLVRAIEVATHTNSFKTPDFWLNEYMEKPPDYNALIIGLNITDRQKLYSLIDQRVEERLGNNMDQEIAFLKNSNLLDGAPSRTIGYKQWIKYINNQLSKSEAIQQWKFAEHAYARKQITWFKKQPGIHWFDPTQPKYKQQIVKKVNEWYSNNKKIDGGNSSI